MKPRAWLALLLLVVVTGLTPLAQASPPDPTWVAGFWDDGDYDDVVLLVGATAAVVHAAPPLPDVRRALIATLPIDDPGAPPLRSPAPAATRAPPRV